MSETSQLEYLAAVKCLMAKPANGQQYFPAVQSRYDDCAAMHINATQGASLSLRRYVCSWTHVVFTKDFWNAQAAYT